MNVITHPISVRIGNWIAGRRGPESGDVLLDRRRVYILPTMPGLVFGAAMLVLLIGSINYMLQLGFLLTFLVASMALVGMHSTHANLAQVVLRGVRVEPVFAGELAVFELSVTNPTTVDRFALRFFFLPTAGAGSSRQLFGLGAVQAVAPLEVSIELPARGDCTVGVPLEAAHRGYLPAPRIVVETRFPFGLWRAWAYLIPALTATVYPAPELDAPPLPATAGGDTEGEGLAATGDDFAGVRPYQPGDPLKMIAWRLAARSDELSVKQFEARGGGEVMLDYDSLPAALDPELRLSRLARWVLDADAAHLRYGLRLPDAMIFAGTEPQHREHCLTALAVCRL